MKHYIPYLDQDTVREEGMASIGTVDVGPWPVAGTKYVTYTPPWFRHALRHRVVEHPDGETCEYCHVDHGTSPRP